MLTRSHRTRSSLCALCAQHGGGYSYRICPASSPLTEACFQSHPLDFVPSKSALLLPDGSRIPITPLHVSTGTQPAGSTWSRIPIPPTDLGPRCLPGPKDNASTPHGCTPADKENGYMGPCEPCPETPGSDCSRCGQSKQPAFPPLANWTENQGGSSGFSAKKGDPIQKGGFALGILDVLKIPADLPEGDYVLGWRWDCEATSQVNHYPNDDRLYTHGNVLCCRIAVFSRCRLTKPSHRSYM